MLFRRLFSTTIDMARDEKEEGELSDSNDEEAIRDESRRKLEAFESKN